MKDLLDPAKRQSMDRMKAVMAHANVKRAVNRILVLVVAKLYEGS